MEILELKKKLSKIKNSMDGINSRIDMLMGEVSGLEDINYLI